MDGTGTDCPLAMRLSNLRVRELDACSLLVMGKPAVANGDVTNAGSLKNPNIVIGNGGSSIKDSLVNINDVVRSPAAAGGPLTANTLVFGSTQIGNPGFDNTVQSSTIGVTGGNSLTNVNNLQVTTINGVAPGSTASVTGTAPFITASPTTGNVVVSLSGPTAKGSIIVGNGASPAVLTAGTDTFVLQANHLAPNGVNWIDPATLFSGIGTGTDKHVVRWAATPSTIQDSGVTLAGPSATDFTGVVSINCSNTTEPIVASSSFVAGCFNVSTLKLDNGAANGAIWSFINTGTAQVDGAMSGYIASLILAGGGSFNITGNQCLVMASQVTAGTMGTANNILAACTVNTPTMNCSSSAIMASANNPTILGTSVDCTIIGCIGGNQIGANPATKGTSQIILASTTVQSKQDYSVCGGHSILATATTNRTWELRSAAVGGGDGTVPATGAGALALKDAVYTGKTFGDVAEMYENSVSGIIPDGTILTHDSDKCKVAAPGDPILGVVSATATVVSGVAEFCWHKRYKTNRFGRIEYERDQNGQLVGVESPAYKADQPYVSRLSRPQDYTICGYSGRVLVRAGDYDWSTALYAQPGPDGKAQPSVTPTRLEVEMLHSAYDPADGFAVVLCLIR